jgi:hypothetical protein
LRHSGQRFGKCCLALFRKAEVSHGIGCGLCYVTINPCIRQYVNGYTALNRLDYVESPTFYPKWVDNQDCPSLPVNNLPDTSLSRPILGNIGPHLIQLLLGVANG